MHDIRAGVAAERRERMRTYVERKALKRVAEMATTEQRVLKRVAEMATTERRVLKRVGAKATTEKASLNFLTGQLRCTLHGISLFVPLHGMLTFFLFLAFRIDSAQR